MWIHWWPGYRKSTTRRHKEFRVKFTITAPEPVNGDSLNHRIVPIVFSTPTAITEPNQRMARKLTSPAFPAHQRPARSLFCHFAEKRTFHCQQLSSGIG